MSETNCYRAEKEKYGEHMALVEVLSHARELIHDSRFLKKFRGSHGIENLAEQIYRRHSTPDNTPNFLEVLNELQWYKGLEYIPEIISEVEEAKKVLESLVGAETSTAQV